MTKNGGFLQISSCQPLKNLIFDEKFPGVSPIFTLTLFLLGIEESGFSPNRARQCVSVATSSRQAEIELVVLITHECSGGFREGVGITLPSPSVVGGGAKIGEREKMDGGRREQKCSKINFLNLEG